MKTKFEELLDEIEEQISKGIMKSSERKDDVFRSIKKEISSISEEFERRMGLDLEDFIRTIEVVEKASVERDTTFLERGVKPERDLVESVVGPNMTAEEIRVLTKQIQTNLENAIEEKETKQTNPFDITSARENGFLLEFSEKLNEAMRNLRNCIEQGGERFFGDMVGDISRYLSKISMQGEELAEEEVNSQRKMLEELENTILEFEQRNIREKEEQEQDFSVEQKREMLERYRNGEFQVRDVKGKSMVYVLEHQEDENGNVTQKGILYTEKAFQEIFGSDTMKGRFVTVAGTYYDITQTEEEFQLVLKGNEKVSGDRTGFTPEEEQQIVEKIFSGTLTLDQGVIPTYKIRDAVIDPETQRVVKTGLRISEKAFQRYFSGASDFCREEIGDTTCYMEEDEVEKVKEAVRKTEKLQQENQDITKRRRDPNAYQKALKESGLDVDDDER